MSWLNNTLQQNMLSFVTARRRASKRLKLVEAFATGSRPCAFTLAASQKSRTVAGYIDAASGSNTLPRRTWRSVDSMLRQSGFQGRFLVVVAVSTLWPCACKNIPCNQLIF